MKLAIAFLFVAFGYALLYYGVGLYKHLNDESWTAVPLVVLLGVPPSHQPAPTAPFKKVE